MNRVMLMGHIGRDAEMRFTGTGTAVATFNLATTQRYTDRSGDKREETQWHRLVLWGKGAEGLIDYLKKGKQVAVEGMLVYRKWNDKNGVERTSAEVRVERVHLAGGRGGPQREPGEDEEEPVAAGKGKAPADEDDIPF